MTKRQRRKFNHRTKRMRSGQMNDLNLDWLACMHCGRPLDVHSYICVFKLEDTGELTVVCSSCADYWKQRFASIGMKPWYESSEEQSEPYKPGA